MTGELNINIIPILVGITVAVVTAFLGFFIWGVKAIVTTTLKNTIAVNSLSERMEEMLKNTEKIPKLERDVNYAHEKLRNIERQES